MAKKRRYIFVNYILFSHGIFGSKTKINIFWNCQYFATIIPLEKFQKTMILDFEANSALSLQIIIFSEFSLTVYSYLAVTIKCIIIPRGAIQGGSWGSSPPKIWSKDA